MNKQNHHQCIRRAGGNTKTPVFIGCNAFWQRFMTHINYGSTTNTLIKKGVGGGEMMAVFNGKGDRP